MATSVAVNKAQCWMGDRQKISISRDIRLHLLKTSQGFWYCTLDLMRSLQPVKENSTDCFIGKEFDVESSQTRRCVSFPDVEIRRGSLHHH